MINRKLVREYEKKQKGHILFDRQRAADLDQMQELLEKEGKPVIAFPPEEWYHASQVVLDVDKGYRLEACRKYAATKFLAALEEKYPQVREYEGSKYLPIFQSGDREAYIQNKGHIYTLKDVLDILEVEGIKLDRVHIFMNGIRSDNMCDAVCMLLSKDNPFSTTVYNSPNGFYSYYDPDKTDKTTIYDSYSFTVFEAYEEGRKNRARRNPQKQKSDDKNAK